MIRRLFYRGRHFATTTEGAPVLVSELQTTLQREAGTRWAIPTYVYSGLWSGLGNGA